MYRYEIEFTGRKAGALGICQHFRETVVAESVASATLKLYDDYEHIRVLFVKTKGEANVEPTLRDKDASEKLRGGK